MKLKHLFLLSSLMISSLFALDTYSSKKDMHKDKKAVPENIYHIGENGFNINASYIFWQPKEEGTELGLFGNESATAHASVIYLDENYKSGFKVGAGYAMPYDNWEINAEYTWFHNSHSKSKSRSGTNEYIVPYWAGMINVNHDSAIDVTSNWTLCMDMAYLDLSHPLYIGKELFLNFNSGLKGGRIDQKMYAHYNLLVDTDYETANWKSDSWLIGPKAAILTKWMMSDCIFMSANFTTALLYQKFDVKGDQAGKDSDAISGKALLKAQYSMLNANLELFLGLGYTQSYCENAYNFMANIGYEFITYFNQNMMRHYRDNMHVNIIHDQSVEINTSYHSIGNLFLHGLTVKAQFDF